MEVERVGRIVEGEDVVVIVQEDAQALHLGMNVKEHLLVVMPHYKAVVAAGENPRGGVLADPLVLRG